MVDAFMAFPHLAGTFRAALAPAAGGPPDCERLLPKAADLLARVLVRFTLILHPQHLLQIQSALRGHRGPICCQAC